MARLQAINKKARRVDDQTLAPERVAGIPAGIPASDPVQGVVQDVVGLQGGGAAPGPHIPMGCSFVFSPGWEVDSSGGTAGLCQPVERDLYDCHITCFWPAHVPDLYNHAPDWVSKCASAQKDWRKIDLIFP